MRSTPALLLLLAALAAASAGCATGPRGASAGFRVPPAADKVAHSTRSSKRIVRTCEFEKKQKGVFDNYRVSLYTVTCMNEEHGDHYIYPFEEQWCVYHLLMKPDCHAGLDEAMQAVCADPEIRSKRRTTVATDGSPNSPSLF